MLPALRSFARLLVLGPALAACGGIAQEPSDSGSPLGGGCDEVGGTKPADDGCNTCTCTEQGWQCTEMACPERECEPGDSKADSCTICSCSQLGRWECAYDLCPELKSCGGLGGGSCTADEYCAYEIGQLCGADDVDSDCKPRPTVCGEIYDPVCGCDGLSYVNPCSANSAGTGIAHAGECEAP